jgi:hypothetical protein
MNMATVNKGSRKRAILSLSGSLSPIICFSLLTWFHVGKTMSGDQEVQVWERKIWSRISLKFSEYSLQMPSVAPL